MAGSFRADDGGTIIYCSACNPGKKVDDSGIGDAADNYSNRRKFDRRMFDFPVKAGAERRVTPGRRPTDKHSWIDTAKAHKAELRDWLLQGEKTLCPRCLPYSMYPVNLQPS